MIDQATIDRILDAAQIVDVVSEFVTLRKRGVNYVGLCPFHNEKTPSFSVSPSKGLCKCFSCGKGGNAVHFVMEHEQMSYYEALKYLAKKYNIEIKERELTNEEKQAQSTRESMFIVNNFARDYFQNILKNHVDGRSIGMAYFRKSNELYGIYFAKQAIVKQDRCFLVEGYTDVISMHQSGVENVVASSGTSLTPGQIRLIHRFTNNITVLYDGDMAGIKASIRGIDMLLEEGMNIKVCLLPDGDDPDSFARKHNATEFQQFIKEHETDFIRFKTNLLLEDAGKDPIKRAELINNIVQSISVIPEAIVRDVYIKECGQLLRVEDKLLVSEVAKRREIQAEKENKPILNNPNNAPSGMPADVSGGDFPPPFLPDDVEDPYRSYIPQEGKEGQEFYRYERLVIQAIIRYGEKIMCNMEDEEGKEIPVSVIEYVVNDLKEDDLAFHNPMHRRILTEAMTHVHDSGFIAERYFIAHSDPELSSIATELASDRYQLSKFHSKTQKITTDEERLFELVPLLMINFKNAIVAAELKHIMYALQDPVNEADDEKCAALMQRYKEMKQIESLMAKRLGDRVVLR